MALVPEVADRLVGSGLEVTVEVLGAGAGMPIRTEHRGGRSQLAMAGRRGRRQGRLPGADEIGRLGRGRVLIAFLQPLTAGDTVRARRRGRHELRDGGDSAYHLGPADGCAPSSQATVWPRGADGLPGAAVRFFPMLTTAAGTVRPAKVPVLGAGVAGLQAIATARRLGATSRPSTCASAVKEQIELLGARFLELDMGLEDAEAAGGYARQLTDEEQAKQRDLLAVEIGKMDAVISTAAVPGRRAPLS